MPPTNPANGWIELLKNWPWFVGEDNYPLPAYSEFLPPPRLGKKPYGGDDLLRPEPADDPWGWPVSEYEQAFELDPGLDKLAAQLLKCLVALGEGRASHNISKARLKGNPYWPDELAAAAGSLGHERYVMLSPLALSRTQDDKGRVRWTLFGGSEQGPARGFWQSFYTAPGVERPAEESLDFVRRLLAAVYDETADALTDLTAAGFRVLAGEEPDDWPGDEALPGWTEPYRYRAGQSLRGVTYLLTFLPFARLPAAVRRAYLAGELRLLPFPGSLIFWGAKPYLSLREEFPFAAQIPLLFQVGRHESWQCLRVPQSGWMREPKPAADRPPDGEKTRKPETGAKAPRPASPHGPIRNTFKRTHRTAKVHRYDDELALTEKSDKLVQVLFSARSEDLGLYGKPMARNVQLWGQKFGLVLDGPHAGRADIEKAMKTVARGGLFGYRFLYPAMRVGRHELYWHRPLVAFLKPGSKAPCVLPDAPAGYLTGYLAGAPDLTTPVELWPRLLRRPEHLIGVGMKANSSAVHAHQTTLNVRKLLDTHALLGGFRLPRSFARNLLTMPKKAALDDWLEALPNQAETAAKGEALVQRFGHILEPAGSERGKRPRPLTFAATRRRAFEVNYWRTIAFLAEGKYLTKNNADCVRDKPTQQKLPHHHRDLDQLADHLLRHHTLSVRKAGMADRAVVGEVPFAWRTDFNYNWSGGWVRNQEHPACERDLIVVIPGRDRGRAVIMADHYDTAYMADEYDKKAGGNGARLAAAGADDNHSATAALMLAAPIFLKMSREGKLACDVWLVHLTGEEFPADCLGARALTQRLVEGNLAVRARDGLLRDAGPHDLSATRVSGVYVLDMVAHNNTRDLDVFQISPGAGSQSMWLAYQAHLANRHWNNLVPRWNKHPTRAKCGRGRRSPRGSIVPRTARYLALHGEIRPSYDPRSTLYNTDGQIFSDAGIPVVLFMENYDINRSGYHDTRDTMENINLDYGAALTAVAIEAVARAATETPPG